MKPEQALNNKLRMSLRGRDPFRVENAVGPGTPDIYYIGGWIESKVIKDVPKRGGVVKVPHYRPDQRAWHVRHRKAGGRVHVVIEVTAMDTTFVFDGADAAVNLGVTWDTEHMFRRAPLVMRPFDGARFRRFIDQCDADRY